MTRSIAREIRDALLTPEPRDKVMATRRLARGHRKHALPFVFDVAMPERPAWPESLQLLPPSRMPRRGGGGSERKRIALWHSLAHIEFVAIDLALDMAGRFGAEMGPEFVADFLSVAADEAMHFALIARKLATLGSHYGALPVHDGLWEAAHATRADVAARLAVVPMVLEARGLDVTPATLTRIREQGDKQGARILERILMDEIRHVRIGTTHFTAHCRLRDELPEQKWKLLVARYFRGVLKPPFNDSARSAAGLSRSFYGAVA